METIDLSTLLVFLSIFGVNHARLFQYPLGQPARHHKTKSLGQSKWHAYYCLKGPEYAGLLTEK
jgi:hypothetical protein